MHTSFLIVGAGPFGLAMAAHAQVLGVEHVVVGRPMSFWKQHMPAGMVLRSGCNWHLDPAEHDTLELFLAARGRTPETAEPIPLDLYLEYAEWFQRLKGIRARSAQVARLEQSGERFVATLDDGSTVTADRVLLALGFAPFANVPGDLAERVPAERSSHTCDCAAPSAFHGLRVLIVGGRQSAFETAALLAEAGAASVYVSHRHETPSFAPSDWAWVDPLLERIGDEPTWYRNLSDAERKTLDARFWSEGRLKLEPWLGPRVQHPAIAIRARTRIAGCDEAGTGLRVRFDAGDVIDVDHVVYATGYKVDMQRVEMLKAGGLIDRIECRDGSPRLDDSMQTTVPGLFVTSLPAARDFGLFFAFTAAVRASARIVGRALHEARR